MTRDEEDVGVASARFYEALNQVCHGHPGLMMDVWHQTPRVTTAHPLGEWAHGWEEVWASWQEISHTARNGNIVARDLRIFVYEAVAYTTCVEDVAVTFGANALRWRANVTNIFRKAGGEWKMIHHHSDKAQAVEEAVDKMADV
jgi:ketosteroid isomerase-like protein